MIPRIVSAQVCGVHRVRLRFADGVDGEVDLSEELWGEVFEPLRDQSKFARMQLNEELNTITWETGADLAPEFLYEQVKQASVSR